MNAPRYDAIVIGSGAGGAAAAFGLVSAGMRVLMLEKGDHLPRDGSTLDVPRVVHAGEFFSREPWVDGRGRPLRPEEHFNVGGKTKWYGAALLRFGEHEFLPDARHGCRGWPIGLSDLAPYYAHAERLLGVRTLECEPDLARIVARVARGNSGWRVAPMPMALDARIAADPNEAAHFDGFASVKNLKGEAESSILSRLLANEHFTLMPRAEAEHLLGAPDAPTTVSGVRLRDGRTYTAPHVLLAAGALHSPRLLAGYLRHTELETALPAAALIGRHVKLHLLSALISLSPGVKTDLIRKTAFLLNERFPHSSIQPLGFDSELIATLMPQFVPDRLRRALGRHAYGFFLQTEDGSDMRNQVRDGAPPVLDYDQRRLPAAMREHRRLTYAFQRALLQAGLVSFTKRIGLNGTAHVCGSLICGHSPSESVVDAAGRVHGMKGLYVVDGSVLPRSSRVNPSLTIFAWALRVADLLSAASASERPVRLESEAIHVA